MADYLEIFGELSPDNHKPTSPQTNSYNCIAWAAEDDQRWWQPGVPSDLGYYWPTSAPLGYHPDCLIAAFKAIGYELCGDGAPMSNVQKVALYVNSDNRWTHAARQLPSGKWTSKLGKLEDIEHETPEVIGGEPYGSVYCFMARPAS